MNRLQHETSPYLLQHKDNPVDWYPWGAQALEKAQAEDKPILLSVGYSACHWCHVMAHESFEHDETADMMNRWFINVKVDREERPDVDDIYMQAVQALVGRGGWPMTVFLTPQARPFYGGTYYPKEPRMGMPSFRQVLAGVYDAYTNRRDEVEESASGLTDALKRDVLSIGATDDDLNTDLLDTAARQIRQNADRERGGFGGAPKFPQPMTLEFLLRTHARTGDTDALSVAEIALQHMADGGIHDQIGGGFARYSTDEVWLVPHFEKMLYDNAQLSRVYLHAWQLTGDTDYRRVAEATYDYILREMTAPEGGFYSATDADSEGEEGKFFVWTPAEIREVLSEEDAELAIDYYGVTEGGNFEGQNILHRPQPHAEVAQSFGLTADALRDRLELINAKLYNQRKQRVPPGLDDKILASWNGLMLASLAEAARVFDDESHWDYLDAAIRCADFLTTTMTDADGRLYRTSKDGQAKLNAYLEDYANVIDGLLELYQTTFNERWFTEARRLADVVLEQFAAEDGAGFYDTSHDHEQLVVRPRNLQDNATPAGNTMIATQLLRLAAYTGDARYDEAARGVLRLLANAIRQYPLAFGQALCALDMAVSGIQEVAVVGDPDDPSAQALLDVVRLPYTPNIVIALALEDVPDEATIPLLSYRQQKEGAPTVYVCQNFACQMPVHTAAQMRELLGMEES